MRFPYFEERILMTKNNFKYHIHWIHMLAWMALDADDLSKEERKAIGAFNGYVKNGKYISENNTLLAKVVKIVDAHSPVKSTAQPAVKDKYSNTEKKDIRKGIRELYKSAGKGTAVWEFCNRFLYSATGKRRTKPHSENRYWHAQMTLAIHGI